MAEVIRLEYFSCAAALSADSKSLDMSYICPSCGPTNYKPLSFKDFQNIMQESLDAEIQSYPHCGYENKKGA